MCRKMFKSEVITNKNTFKGGKDFKEGNVNFWVSNVNQSLDGFYLIPFRPSVFGLAPPLDLISGLSVQSRPGASARFLWAH